MIQFSCSSCGKRYKVKPDLGGKKTKCLECANPILIPTSSEKVPVAAYAEIVDQADGAIEVSIGFFPLGWLFYFFTPVVVINGISASQRWGRHYFEMPPGTYAVKIFIPYLLWPECGANTVTFDLRPGELKRVSFYMWPWVFAKGSMRVT